MALSGNFLVQNDFFIDSDAANINAEILVGDSFVLSGLSNTNIIGTINAGFLEIDTFGSLRMDGQFNATSDELFISAAGDMKLNGEFSSQNDEITFLGGQQVELAGIFRSEIDIFVGGLNGGDIIIDGLFDGFDITIDNEVVNAAGDVDIKGVFSGSGFSVLAGNAVISADIGVFGDIDILSTGTLDASGEFTAGDISIEASTGLSLSGDFTSRFGVLNIESDGLINLEGNFLADELLRVDNEGLAGDILFNGIGRAGDITFFTESGRIGIQGLLESDSSIDISSEQSINLVADLFARETLGIFGGGSGETLNLEGNFSASEVVIENNLFAGQVAGHGDVNLTGSVEAITFNLKSNATKINADIFTELGVDIQTDGDLAFQGDINAGNFANIASDGSIAMNGNVRAGTFDAVSRTFFNLGGTFDSEVFSLEAQGNSLLVNGDVTADIFEVRSSGTATLNGSILSESTFSIGAGQVTLNSNVNTGAQAQVSARDGVVVGGVIQASGLSVISKAGDLIFNQNVTAQFINSLDALDGKIQLNPGVLFTADTAILNSDNIFATIDQFAVGTLDLLSDLQQLGIDVDVDTEVAIEIPTVDEINVDVPTGTTSGTGTGFDSAPPAEPTPATETVEADATIEEIQELIVDGEDPTDLLEATAASNEELVLDLTEQPLITVTTTTPGMVCTPK